MLVLSVNAGSSSLKVGRFDGGAAISGRPAPAGDALVERIGHDDGAVRVTAPDGAVLVERAEPVADHAQALATVLDVWADAGAPHPDAAGHRIVHGGPHLTEHTVIDDAVRRQLDRATPFAPLHLPVELRLVDAVAARYPDLPQVACFDTAFHRDLPPEARRLPLPATYDAHGVRRYGFHGLSCEYLVETLGAEVLGRAVLAHLGSGSSLTAVRGGRSIDTSMGLTPTGGVVMGTRTGDLDPGVVVHLLRTGSLDADALEHLLDHESGLQGISGRSNDVRDLLAARDGDADADLALTIYCRSIRKAIGAFATLLDGLDTVVFTAGVGEHASAVRAETCAGLGHLGLHVDEERNQAAEPVISTDDSLVSVRVEPTDEDVVVASHTRRLLAGLNG